MLKEVLKNLNRDNKSFKNLKFNQEDYTESIQTMLKNYHPKKNLRNISQFQLPNMMLNQKQPKTLKSRKSSIYQNVRGNN